MTETQKQELEKLKLPVPNPYGTTVKIDRVNMLIERAYKAGLATATQQAVEEAAESERLLQSVVMQGTALALDHIECGKWLEATRRVKWIRNYIKAQQALSQKGEE